MNIRIFRGVFMALMLLFSTISATANISIVSDEEVEKCNTVELRGSEATDIIKISALSKGMATAFITLPGDKDYTAKDFKYLVSGSATGCFGVMENFRHNGRNYPAAAIMVALDIDPSGGVDVIYSISSDGNTLVDGSFRLNNVRYIDPDRNSYVDSDWAIGFNNFEKWLTGHAQEYKE